MYFNCELDEHSHTSLSGIVREQSDQFRNRSCSTLLFSVANLSSLASFLIIWATKNAVDEASLTVSPSALFCSFRQLRRKYA